MNTVDVNRAGNFDAFLAVHITFSYVFQTIFQSTNGWLVVWMSRDVLLPYHWRSWRKFRNTSTTTRHLMPRSFQILRLSSLKLLYWLMLNVSWTLQGLTLVNTALGSTQATNEFSVLHYYATQLRRLVVWIPGIPLWKGLLLRDTPRIPNHRVPNHKFTISWFQEILQTWTCSLPQICFFLVGSDNFMASGCMWDMAIGKIFYHHLCPEIICAFVFIHKV